MYSKPNYMKIKPVYMNKVVGYTYIVLDYM